MLTDPRTGASGGGDDAWLFAAAFQASRRAMILTDPGRDDNPIVTVNEAAERLTGYRRAELIGRNCRLLQGRDTSPSDVAVLRAAIAAGEGAEVELLNYRKDGSAFWNAMAISPVRDTAGILVRFVASLEDVTGRREADAATMSARGRLEAEIARRTQDLQAALDQQTALLHEVDHRVKNNLQVISSLVLLKARRMSDPGSRAVLQSMADRISAISTVHRLLYAVGDVSRFDLQAFATDFAADLASTVPAGRIRIDLDVDAVAVSAAKAAPLALLIHELATNAVRHAFPAERAGRVAISAKRRNDEVAVLVEDDGVGLGATEPNPDGFGRSLVDMVVRQMRGRMDVEDALPGTRARIAIPLNAEEAQL